MKMRASLLPGLLFAVCGWISTTIACKGCISLDEYNFDKIIPRFKAVLVKFDVAYPYGDKHEVFTKFAEEIVTNRDLIAAEVGVKDYGDKENEELAKKFGINTKEELPSVILFTKDVKNYVKLPKDAAFTIDSLRNLVRDNTDIYIGLPGCLEEYDKMAMSFVKSDNKETKLSEAEKKIDETDEQDKPTAKTYIQVMKKIIEQGINFISNEKSRLGKIIKEGKVNEKKKQELSYRLNILHSFTLKKDEL